MSTSIQQQRVGNLLAFTGAERPAANAVFILVMGVTGSGKSTFVSQCTGQDVDIGHDLVSCTTQIGVYDFELGDQTVYLIDTPGFDDTNYTDRPDAATLQTLAAYLAASYKRNVRIHGIVFMHSITENRVTGSARRNIDVLKQLAGQRFFPNIAVATTHWTSTLQPRSTLRDRERELATRDVFFGSLVGSGAQMFRHDEGEASARRIVEHLVCGRGRSTSPLALQRELVDEGRKLESTAAGLVVVGAAGQKLAEAKAEVASLKMALKDADQGHAAMLREMKAENEQIVKTIERARKCMAIRVEEISKREQELVVQRLRQTQKEAKSRLAAQEAQLATLQEEVKKLRGKRRGSAHKPSHSSKHRQKEEAPPPYEEAIAQKQTEVKRTQATVTQLKEKTFEQELLVASVPALIGTVAAVGMCVVM